MVWLVALHDKDGVDVETASFSPAREPGLVNGNLLLRRP
jgi:type II secretory pathway component PulM